MPDEKKPPVTEKIKSELNKIPPTSDRNMMAAFSYVWILSLVMLVAKRNEPFVQFHAKQGIVLLIISIIASILFVVPPIGAICWMLAAAGMVVGFIQAWQGKEYKLPLIYGWSQKVKF